MELVLYGRDGCHLCDQMSEELDECLRGRVPVRVVDVDSNPALCERHGLKVPVLELDGEELCHGRLDASTARRLAAAFSGRD
jgi:hypothetical protein